MSNDFMITFVTVTVITVVNTTVSDLIQNVSKCSYCIEF